MSLRGGLLDVVVSRDDLTAPRVDIIYVGLSDHQLLRWTAPLVRPPPVYTTAVRRPWNRLDADAFRAGLRTSLLCQTDAWPTLDVDGLAQLYNSEITMLLDLLIPARSITYRRRPSDPWFDGECRATKRSTRQLERAVHRATTCDAPAATAAWVARLRCASSEETPNVLAEQNRHRKQGSTSTVAIRRCFDGPRAYSSMQPSSTGSSTRRWMECVQQPQTLRRRRIQLFRRVAVCTRSSHWQSRTSSLPSVHYQTNSPRTTLYLRVC